MVVVEVEQEVLENQFLAQPFGQLVLLQILEMHDLYQYNHIQLQ
tara:strand:- start:355 stop:486 length:132 start_codon:yes stop_codon:yes gene_type:complete